MGREYNHKTLYRLYYTEGKTLADIGQVYGVTRERIRQVFEKEGIARTKNRPHRHPNPWRLKYYSLEQYLTTPRTSDANNKMLNRFIEKTTCAECGSNRNLYIHHLRNPIKTKGDLEILCASCHGIRHRDGITHAKRVEIFTKYILGINTKELAREYDIARDTVYKIIQLVRQDGHSFLDIRTQK